MAVSTSIFFLPSKIDILLSPFLKLIIFKASDRDIGRVNFTYINFPAKRLRKFLLKNIIPNAHAYVQSYTTRKRTANSC